MNRIIASTALALMLGTASFTSASAQMMTYQSTASDMYASDLIGSRIYSAEAEYDTFTTDTTIAAGAEQEWDDLGEVNDVILSSDGKVQAVILGIGGFIGIGERDIAVSMDQIKTVREADGDDTFLVVKTNKEELEALPEFERFQMEQTVAEAGDAAATKVEETAAATTAAAGAAATTVATTTENAAAEVKEETAEAATAVENTTEAATQEVAEAADEATAEVKEEVAEVKTEATETTVPVQTAEDTTGAQTSETVVVAETPEREMLVRPEIVRDGYNVVAMEDLTTEQLTGARVYGINDEDIGEIDEILVSEAGTIDRVVLDVGGFLGIGEREVAVTMDELNIVRNEDGSDLRVYIQATQEQLEAQPEYKD